MTVVLTRDDTSTTRLQPFCHAPLTGGVRRTIHSLLIVAPIDVK